ncbi:MAG: energy transducer TonB [Nitrospira sp.]|nr:energy transducer TonB [Nitrospira sp.]
MVAVAVPTPDEADDSTALPSSDIAATPQTLEESQHAVDNATQGPPASDVQSVVAAEQRADGPTDPPTEVALSSANAMHTRSVEAAPDFGWLMQMLWSRVTELKHYPSEARMNRLEGRVVVRVVIDEQGRLLDATIATGSGHALLDHAALDVIRRSCPLSLPQALGRHQIVLRVPIQYRLDS